MLPTRSRRKELRKRCDELQVLLSEWDPIGVGPERAKDEYDCLVAPVMTQLANSVPVAGLVTFLKNELHEHFGIEPLDAGVEAFAARAHDWFEHAGMKKARQE